MLTPEELSRLPFKRGHLNAKIAFVGEAPGRQEAADPSKRAFIGAAGDLLEKMVQNANIPLSDVYYTNVIKEYPEGRDIHKWIAANTEKYSIYLKILANELESLKDVNVISPVGGVALKAICSRNSIEAWRGSIIPATLNRITGRKCIPTIHTAAILRNWLYKPATVLDMQRIAEERSFPEIVIPQRKSITRPNYEQVLDYIHKCKTSTEKISLDLETLPRPQRIVSLQLAISPYEAICIPFQYKNGQDYWPDDQELTIWLALIDLLENCGKRIIGQNILTFDLFMLAAQGFRLDRLLENVWLDTMEAFQCLEPELPRGLDFLTSIYTKEPYYKSEGKQWGTREGEDEFWTYGCKDVMVVSEIAPQLYKELVEDNLLEFYYERFQDIAKPRLKMSMRGLRRSEEVRSKLEREFQNSIMVEQARVNVLAGEHVNVKSHPQMVTLLYDKMKLPKQWKRSGDEMRVTCDEDAILTLSAKHPGKVFEHIIKLRKLRTLYSNNIKAKVDSDGRIRSSFGFTETGRFRSFECPLGSGGNLQNWNAKMRVMVVPDPRKVFVEGDLSQAEARVVAWAGHITYMMEVFKRDPKTPEGDIHRHMAALIYEKLVEEIAKGSLERYSAKRIVHACDYDMHSETFSKRYNKDAAEAGRITGS